jgi:hypothetical protein
MKVFAGTKRTNTAVINAMLAVWFVGSNFLQVPGGAYLLMGRTATVYCCMGMP